MSLISISGWFTMRCVLRIFAYVCLQDAASLAIAIMKKGLRSRVFVGCDNEPLSRSMPNSILFNSLFANQR